MKKFFQILGIVFLVIIVGIAGAIGYAAYTGSGLDASSRAYVDQSIPVITNTWSEDELLKRASPELMKMAKEKPDQWQQLFAKLSQLGACKTYDGSKGTSNVFFDSKGGKTITATYTAHAVYEHGEAQISVRLVQHDGVWQYLYFYVNSPLFLK